MKLIQIGVIGWAGKEEYSNGGAKLEELMLAEEVGKFLAMAKCIVITGGKGGVMEMAAKGAKSKDGTTVGIIKGPRGTSNKWIDIEVITGSHAAGFDELLVPIMCDAVIVIGGGAGTLQEICVAYRNKIPIVIILKAFGCVTDLFNKEFLDDRNTVKFVFSNSAKEAVDTALMLAKQISS